MPEPTSPAETRAPSAPGPAAPPRPGLGYQPALDGWRGVGILMVMAYHAGLRTVVPGAFLWIDGFFTVSAFLIATLLLEESERNRLAGSPGAGRVSLGAFWGRRVRRLGPALVVTLVAMAAFRLVTDRAQAAALPGDVLATLFYVANWRSVASGSDYFAAFVNDSPLKHTWSLAIEEQFYLVFPLLLVGLLALARRRGRTSIVRPLGVLALGGALASAGWMAWLRASGSDISRLYYGTDTRAQSLLAGVALAAARLGAFSPRRDPASSARPRIDPKVWVGLGAIGFAAVFVGQFFVHEDSDLLYRGGFLLAAAVQAVTFRGLLEPAWFQRALQWRPLVWVGGLAYGLYLFHFPLFLWLSPDRVGFDGPALFALRFAVTFAVAIPVYRFIEKPVRIRTWPPAGSLAAKVAWPVAVAVIAAVALVAPVPALEPTKADLAALVVTPGPNSGSGTGATRRPTTTTSGSTGGTTDPSAPVATTDPVTTEPKAPPRIAIVGDSTGTRLAPGLEAWANATGAAVWAGDGARVGCPLGRGGEMHTAADATGEVNPLCNWADAAANGFDGVPRPRWPDLVRDWRPDLVVVSFGPWDVADRTIPGDPTWRAPGDPAYDRWLRSEMDAAVATLTAGGAHIVWLTQPPWEGATRHPPERLYPPAADPARMTRLNELVEQLAADRPDAVTAVELADWIASTGDDAHLRPDGAHFEPETAVEVMNEFLGTALLDVWAST